MHIQPVGISAIAISMLQPHCPLLPQHTFVFGRTSDLQEALNFGPYNAAHSIVWVDYFSVSERIVLLDIRARL